MRRSGPGEPARHEAGHGGIDEGFARVAEALVVLAEAPAVAQPRERPLHRPPARQHATEAGPLAWQAAPLERPRVVALAEWDPFPARLRRVFHDLDRPAQLLLDPGLAGAGVALIDPDVLQPGAGLGRVLQQERHA